MSHQLTDQGNLMTANMLKWDPSTPNAQHWSVNPGVVRLRDLETCKGHIKRPHVLQALFSSDIKHDFNGSDCRMGWGSGVAGHAPSNKPFFEDGRFFEILVYNDKTGSLKYYFLLNR